MSNYRVVIQLNSDDEQTIKNTFGQIRNMRKSGESIDIELVVHGAAGQVLLKDSTWMSGMHELRVTGVRFLICENTLRAKEWTKEHFPEWVVVVPSAVVHIIRRQHEGWAYLKN